MVGTPLYILLVAVIVSTHGNTLGDTTHCNVTADHDLGQGDVTTVITVPKNSTEKTNVGYVKPKEGFEGVSVEVQGGNKSEEAWFPADETCLPADGSWRKFKVHVLSNTEQDKLMFRLYCGKCEWSCDIGDIHITSMEGILVKAHGPSSWNTTPKRGCTALEPDYSPEISNKTCEKPLTRPQASTKKSEASSPIQVWAAVVVGLVVATVVVVVVVVVCLKVKYRCCSNESQPQHTLTESASPAVQQDTRNSLYESLSVFQEAAAPSQH